MGNIEAYKQIIWQHGFVACKMHIERNSTRWSTWFLQQVNQTESEGVKKERLKQIDGT